MTLPKADKRSSTRWILTVLGIEFRRCRSSWSVVDEGTSKPFRLPDIRASHGCTSSKTTNNSGSTDRSVNNGYHITEFCFKHTKISFHGPRRTCKNSLMHRYPREHRNLSALRNSQFRRIFHRLLWLPWYKANTCFVERRGRWRWVNGQSLLRLENFRESLGSWRFAVEIRILMNRFEKAD